MKLDRLLKDKIKSMFYKKCKKMSKKSDEVLRPVSIDVKTILKAIRKSAKLLPWFVYLVEMAVEIVAGRYIPSSYSIANLVLSVVIYVATTFDLVPDFIPFIGLMDDIVLLELLANFLKPEIERFMKWRFLKRLS